MADVNFGLLGIGQNTTPSVSKPSVVALPDTTGADFKAIEGLLGDFRKPAVPNQGLPNPNQPATVPVPQSFTPNTQQDFTAALTIPGVKAIADKLYPNNPTMSDIAASQAVEESGLASGKPSALASKYNNLFGIKGQGTAGSISLPTTEVINGQPQQVMAQFAKFNNPIESFEAHQNLMNKPNYSKVLGANDFNSATDELHNAGYATDPNYAKNLQAIHDKYIFPLNQTIKNTPIKDIQQAHNLPPQNINGGTPLPKEIAQSATFQQGMNNYKRAVGAGLTKSPIATFVDFSKPADQKRLSVVNTQTGKVLFQTYAAQGAGSGDGLIPTNFSNQPGSHASSVGTFLTTQTYDGKHGNSLRIRGLDKGVNDNAESRDIVVHGADYIGNGKTGHSFGCFAVPQEDAPKLINLIKDGTIIYAGKGASPSGSVSAPTPITGIRG